jgi:adenine-specific DNA-methyltransferase
VGVDYRDFYHFLEGLIGYEQWPARIDYTSKHRRLQPLKNIWNEAGTITDALEQLIGRHRDSLIVVSYRDDGLPSEETLLRLLNKYKKQVYVVKQAKKYVLSQRESHELLFIGC